MVALRYVYIHSVIFRCVIHVLPKVLTVQENQYFILLGIGFSNLVPMPPTPRFYLIAVEKSIPPIPKSYLTAMEKNPT